MSLTGYYTHTMMITSLTGYYAHTMIIISLTGYYIRTHHDMESNQCQKYTASISSLEH